MQACELLRLMPTPNTPEALMDAAAARDTLRAAYSRTGSGIVRLNVPFALIRLGAADSDVLLHEAAEDGDVSLSRWARRTLNERNAADQEDFLRTDLNDPEWVTRTRALRELVDLEPPDVIDLIKRGSTERGMRQWALIAQVKHQPQQAAEIIAGVVNDPEPGNRRWAITELLGRDRTEAVRLLKAAAANPGPDGYPRSMRRWAIRRLAQLDLSDHA
jgi:hypothetical protein